MTRQITFIKRSGDWVLWCLGNYIYQFENTRDNKKETLSGITFKDAIKIFDCKILKPKINSIQES